MKTGKGFRFLNYEAPQLTPFEKLFEIFQELITHTSGDVDEALDWLRELDKEYELTDENYTIPPQNLPNVLFGETAPPLLPRAYRQPQVRPMNHRGIH